MRKRPVEPETLEVEDPFPRAVGDAQVALSPGFRWGTATASYQIEGGWDADRKSDDPERVEAAKQWASALAERGWGSKLTYPSSACRKPSEVRTSAGTPSS